MDLQLFEHATEHENYTLEMSITDIYLHNLDFDNAEQVTCVQPLALEFTNDAAWSRNSMVNAWMPSCRTNQGSVQGVCRIKDGVGGRDMSSSCR